VSADAHVATMSLLVFVDDASLSEWAIERARVFAGRHASCVLVLDGGSDRELSGDVHWHEIGVRAGTPEALQSLAAAHLPAGVPRTLLWVAAQTASDPRFVALASEMRTILLDSSRVRDDAHALADLAVFLRSAPDRARAVHDLAYLRLAPWQELVADFFDGQVFVEDLFDLRRVTVASGSDAEGYYLLGWLASRLSWTLDAAGRFRPRGGAREIAYDLVREGRARRVRRIALESNATRFVAELCDNDEQAVSLEVSGAKQRPTRVEPLHDVDIASLFERAMLQEQPDPVFTESLAVAAALVAPS
jgi:glucose-6-phosphate dehydrogenase assembly protein OpcA